MATLTTLQNRRLASTGFIYRDRSHKNSSIETHVVACTDHLAVIIRMRIDRQIPTIDSGYWKMNTSLLITESFVAELKSFWSKLQEQQKILSQYYTLVVQIYETDDTNTFRRRMQEQDQGPTSPGKLLL